MPAHRVCDLRAQIGKGVALLKGHGTCEPLPEREDWIANPIANRLNKRLARARKNSRLTLTLCQDECGPVERLQS